MAAVFTGRAHFNALQQAGLQWSLLTVRVLICCSVLNSKPVVHPVSCSALAQRWNMPRELAYDLAALALYDLVIDCNDFGSMIFEENGEFGAHVMPPPPCELGLEKECRAPDLVVTVILDWTGACMGSMVLQIGVCVLPVQMGLATSQHLV